MAKKQLLCRVLVTTVICGTSFEPNALVKGDEDILKPLVESNELSDNKADVEYCQKELQVEVVNLADLNKNEESDESDNPNPDEKE